MDEKQKIQISCLFNKILKYYRNSQRTNIYEFSSNFDKDLKELSLEINKYKLELKKILN